MVMTLSLLLPHWDADTVGKSRRRRLRVPAFLLLYLLPAADRAFSLPPFHRQAPLSIQELLLTMPLLDQINRASTGLSSLGREPRVPSPEPALLSRSLHPLHAAACNTIGRSQSLICLNPRSRLLLQSPNLSGGSPMHSRRESSRVTSTWTDGVKIG